MQQYEEDGEQSPPGGNVNGDHDPVDANDENNDQNGSTMNGINNNNMAQGGNTTNPLDDDEDSSPTPIATGRGGVGGSNTTNANGGGQTVTSTSNNNNILATHNNNNHLQNSDGDDEEDFNISARRSNIRPTISNSNAHRVINLAPNGGVGGYWRSNAVTSGPSRPISPSATMADNASDISSMVAPANSGMMQRPKSRLDLATSRYSNLSYWRARRVLFYKNGDPFFPGVEFRFKPGRDIGSLEALLDKLSLRMDLPRGARYIFSMDGDRKFTLDELEDGASYVVSSYKTFKVSF